MLAAPRSGVTGPIWRQATSCMLAWCVCPSEQFLDTFNMLSSVGVTFLQRRNRPNLAIGDLVYARVAMASRDMEPELACTDAAGKVGSAKGGSVPELAARYFPDLPAL